MFCKRVTLLSCSLILACPFLSLCLDESRKETAKSSALTIIVLSQSNSYHEQRSNLFRDRFNSQVKGLEPDKIPELLFTHSDFVETHGTWTVFPLIKILMGSQRERRKKLKWVFFCEEETHVDVGRLLSLLDNYDANESYFLGRALHDERATIIHHFAFANDPKQFLYPDFAAGFILSIGLLERIQSLRETQGLKTDFSIDPKHELALFVWDDGKGTSLTHIPDFCSASGSSNSKCITRQPVMFPECPKPIDTDDLFVAVKTCKKFYSTRVKVVKETWGKEASLIEYYSEEADKSIPTVYLGVPNTERGHCGKTMAIIKRFITMPHSSQPPWLLIADDDTIINLDRLRALLACYNHNQPVALGERYGFAVASGGGYDYITGGGGMVFSFPAASLLLEQCKCYSDDAPDDMTLGMCLKGIGIPSTHSRYFHQARPEDYSKEFLSNQIPVSFHKHWEVNPYVVYSDLTKDSLPVRREDETSDVKDNGKEEL